MARFWQGLGVRFAAKARLALMLPLAMAVAAAAVIYTLMPPRSRGEYDLAVDRYTEAILAASPSALLLANRAHCLFLSGRHVAAIHRRGGGLRQRADRIGLAADARQRFFHALEAADR